MNPGALAAVGFVAACVLASAIGLHSQDNAVSADQFRNASASDKTQILVGLATQRTSATTPGVLRQILVGALADPDQNIRKRALSVIASRAGGPRLSGAPAVMARAKNELPHLNTLRELVLARLADAAGEVRAEAVLAIGNLDAAENGWTEPITLKPETFDALVAALGRGESDTAARLRLVEALAVSTNALPKADTWWGDLMRDPLSGVRHYAVRGARKLPAAVALPLLVKSLGDPEISVRMGAAHAIGDFKAAAAHLIPVLLDAADSETDPVVKKTIQAALESLRKQ